VTGKRYHMHKAEREIKDRGLLLDILRRGRYMTIALCFGDEPYTVTLSYGFHEESSTLYFHSALKGMKLDIIRENPKACGTVIEDLGYIHGECSHSYRSVVVYGRMVEVLDPAEKKLGIMTMIEHLERDPHAVKEKLLGKDIDYSGFSVLKLLIDHKTGKGSPPKQGSE